MVKPHLVLARDVRGRERAAAVFICKADFATFRAVDIDTPLERIRNMVPPLLFRGTPHWCIGTAVRGRWRDDDGECVRLSLSPWPCEWAEPIVSGLSGGGDTTLFFDDMDCVEAFLAMIPLNNYDV